MRSVTISISDKEFEQYKFNSENIAFQELLDIISLELAQQALIKCHEIAKKTGLSEMTLNEINYEIENVRAIAKNRH